jgi:hypothetical protein
MLGHWSCEGTLHRLRSSAGFWVLPQLLMIIIMMLAEVCWLVLGLDLGNTDVGGADGQRALLREPGRGTKLQDPPRAQGVCCFRACKQHVRSLSQAEARAEEGRGTLSKALFVLSSLHA